MNRKDNGSGARVVLWIALTVGVLNCGCSPSAQVSPPGSFTFYDTEVTGYTKLKESNGGYEFGIATKVASIDTIRAAIEAKADPSWSTDGWRAKTPQDDVDLISYSNGLSKLTISIQAYKEENNRKWYLVDYSYTPSDTESQQE